MSVLIEKLDSVEQSILKGELAFAAKAINEIYKRNKLPFNRLARFGSLANRSGQYITCLRALNQHIEKEKENIDIIKEYSIALTFLGLRNHAEQLATFLVEQNHPQAHFIRGLIQFGQWNYQDGAQSFENYLKESSLNEYQKRIGELNWAFALNSIGENKKAKNILVELSRSKEATNSQRLKLNVDQLLIQVYYGLEEWDKFGEMLNQVETSQNQPNIHERLSIERWNVIKSYIKTNNLDELEQSLLALFESAKGGNCYEMMRSVHLYLVLYTKNEELLKRVYFGTPYQSFRDHIERIHPSINQITHYHHHTKPGQGSPQLIDLESGKIGNFSELRPQTCFYQILDHMFSDLYRPVGHYELFEAVYPNEFFTPESGLNKLRNTVYRFNKLLESQNLRLRIKSQQAKYTIQADQNFVVKYQLRQKKNEDESWGKVLQFGSGRNFKLQEFTNELNLSRDKGRELLLQYCDEGRIEKIGKTSNTRYRVKKSA